ncbi:MAG: hypothetical protein AB202_00375 [Parcubacteria bacterium C7867-007]|nr:MAG: hypothetical protein AB202_00375 [Parcubacteria bacterium C7867-007]
MINSPIEFLQAVDAELKNAVERARAILWYASSRSQSEGLTTAEITDVMETAGHAKQNRARLDTLLTRDKRYINRVPGRSQWRLSAVGKRELDPVYRTVSPTPVTIVVTDSVLPRALVTGTRGYIEKVTHQINGSYDCGLYDACSVMCRRLLETLIIEVYEQAGRTDEIKGVDGNFLMFSGLLDVFEKDKTFTLSRNGTKGLSDFKSLGDLSAHSRRYNALKADIDRVQSGLRVAVEELLHLAKLK